MTREEAIEMLVNATYSDEWQGNEKLTTAHLMAIEALQGVCFDEWCDDCKEYDTEKKCCPRFNKVIREALKREPSEDGTLEIKVEDATKIGRVLISDDKHRGGLYYPDEDEPQGISFENDTEIKSYSKDSDLISRAEAVKRLLLFKQSRAKSVSRYDMGFVDGLSHAINILDLVPLVYIPSINIIDLAPLADRPRGEWKQIEINGYPYAVCDQCHLLADIVEKDGELVMSMANADEKCANFCPNCGADMRGGEDK